MSDPTVTAFLTKLLCSHGGHLPRQQLPEFLELPTEQIEQILQDEPQKFTLVGELVLARNPMRICTKYLKNEPEEECDKLHLCRHYLQGKCWSGKRRHCNLSHDISSDHNRSVLKANEISGLNEEELKVLLFQNDHQLLPEVCVKYLHDTCDLGKDCTRLHICGFFTRGECNRRICKRSHHLLEFSSDLLINRCRMPEVSIQNFQMLCTVKHNERLQSLRVEGRRENERPAVRRGRGRPNKQKGDSEGMSRNKSRGRQNERADAEGMSRNKSRGRQNERAASNIRGRTSSQPMSESGESFLGWSGDDGDVPRLDKIMDGWFYDSSPSTVKPLMSFIARHPTSTVSISPALELYKGHIQFPLPAASPRVPSAQPGSRTGASTPSFTPSAPQPKSVITPVTTVSPVNSPLISSVGPSRPVNLPMDGPLGANSIKPMSPPGMNSAQPTGPNRLVNYLPNPSVPEEKPVTTNIASPSRPPLIDTIKPVISPAASPSSTSTSNPRLVPSPVEGSSAPQLKSVGSSVRSKCVPDEKLMPKVKPKDVLDDLLTIKPYLGDQVEKESVFGATYVSPKKSSNIRGRTSSRPMSESGESILGWSGDDGDEPRLDKIMDDWFFDSSPSTVQPLTSSTALHPKSTVSISPALELYQSNIQFPLPAASPRVPSAQPGSLTGPSTPSFTPSAPQPKSAITPVTPLTTSVGPSKPVNVPMDGPLGANSIKPMSPPGMNSSTVPSAQPTGPNRLVNYLPNPSVPGEKPVSTNITSQSRPPLVATIKPVISPAASPSSASTSYPRLVLSPAEGSSAPQLKSVGSSVRSQCVPDEKLMPRAEPKDVLDDFWTIKPYLGDQVEKESVFGATCVSPKKSEPAKVPEICLSNLWKYCKLGNLCSDMHYYLPYRWQIFKGTDWEDISNMEEIEKYYCDPKVDRVPLIDFMTLKSGMHRVRRLSTISSVKKPSDYVLTTEWLWHWKDEFGTWTQYGNSNVKQVNSTITSSDLENVYLSDPTAVIPFSAGNQHYRINFPEMKQRNIFYKTEKDVRRRPKFLSFEDVKLLRGSKKSSATKSSPKSGTSPLKTDIYPKTWDSEAMPEIGCRNVLVSDTSSEFSEIVSSFTKTVSGHVVKNMWRLQNPSLWQVFQWQKEQMKKVNQGRDVKEIRLFHGTEKKHIDAICNYNFDWRICGTHGTVYGQGSYFARDASYSHNYSIATSTGTRMMFVARVLVGEYVTGNPQMKRPPLRHGSITRYYDSCVDSTLNPSIFVVFEKHQIYPEYLLEYEEQKKSCIVC